MKLFPLLCCTGLVLGGCQVMPDLDDTTNATLRMRIHYQAPGLTTPMVEIETTVSTLANRCVYVNEPFGVVANVSDTGGVRSITMGPSVTPMEAVKVRNNPGDLLAIPAPLEPTQAYWDETIPNPGVAANGHTVRVAYSTARSYGTVTLLSVYEFRNATRTALRVTARNWGPGGSVSEVYHFYVEKAQPGDPARQPGMPCPLAPGGVG